MSHILITGAAGFIGSHVLDLLVASGHDVVAVDDFSSGSRERLEKYEGKIKIIETDINNTEAYADHVYPNTTIIHLAAFVSVPKSIENPDLSFKTNVSGTHKLMILAKEKGIVRFLSASSAAVYGNNPNIPSHENDPHAPTSPYGLHKVINEEFGALYAELYSTAYTFLRFFNVFGPRQSLSGGYPAVIPILIQKGIKDESPTIFGDGNTTRDFIYVHDLARIIVHIATEPQHTRFEVYNIGTGTEVSLNTLWKEISEICSTKKEPEYREKRTGDIDKSVAHIGKLQGILKDFTFTPLQKALEETIQYYKGIE
ncbi:MAG: NAD-dependent epimerase/dehydratase family protein [Candidatus Taylorbacteria bacterium]|nr:NAD-dependent epimerase/dehydratase family protein [Candidatus Taylorbacteria bacterium]